MINFVNAKLNLGLNIVNRRDDGYHDLETIFYPVGLNNGTPANPDSFCDILEITETNKDIPVFTGRHIECDIEDNLVWKAIKLFRQKCETPPLHVSLDKHIPDGAGLGGGSADASFTLRLLNQMSDNLFTLQELEEMALKLGADCPVFIRNKPAYAEGVGERLEPIKEVLKGKWCVIVKPPVYVSTREAFSGIIPKRPEINLKEIINLPIGEWKGVMYNDFEESIFPKHPELSEIKDKLYVWGAEYASMTGSGSSLYGIFTSEVRSRAAAEKFCNGINSVFVCLL